MLRLLIFIFSVVFFAAAVTILLTLGETVHVEAFGWSIDPPAGVAGVIVAFVLGAVALLVSLYKDFTGLRRRRVLRGVLKRREKGVDALVDAVGSYMRADYAKAGKHAQKAAKLLDRDNLIALLAPPPAPDPAPEPAPVAVEIDPAPPAEAPAADEPLIAAPPDPPPAALPPPAEAPHEEDALDRDAAAARRVS
jgi:hypothetical protein